LASGNSPGGWPLSQAHEFALCAEVGPGARKRCGAPAGALARGCIDPDGVAKWDELATRQTYAATHTFIADAFTGKL
jgi:hypothetical protein